MKSALITGCGVRYRQGLRPAHGQRGVRCRGGGCEYARRRGTGAGTDGSGLSAIAVHMDVSSEEEVEAGFDKMVETYGSCDLVMSNAGVQIVHPFDEYPFADWKKMMAIHADGAFLVSRAAFRRMKASGKGGRIVFTGSVQSFVGSKLKGPYNFAKHGVAGLAQGRWPGRAPNTASIPTPSAPASSRRPWWKSRSRTGGLPGDHEEEVVKNIMRGAPWTACSPPWRMWPTCWRSWPMTRERSRDSPCG